MDFNPGVVLAPLTGVFWGPAGAWGCAVGSLMSDSFFGMWSDLSYYRAAGLFLFALSSKRLWDSFPDWFRGGIDHAPVWNAALRFSIIAMPGCFIAASWSALGSQLLRLYPFSYYLTLQLAVNLISILLLGAALYRLGVSEIVAHLGTWKDVMNPKKIYRPVSLIGVGLLVIGSFGVCIAGLSYSGFHYGHWPARTAYVLGTISEPKIMNVILPFFVLQLLGLFWPGRPVERKNSSYEQPSLDLGV
ncbi:MAG: hypothetical protein AAF492_17395, partial [Verrucomicrobiota bacterium]